MIPCSGQIASKNNIYLQRLSRALANIHRAGQERKTGGGSAGWPTADRRAGSLFVCCHGFARSCIIQLCCHPPFRRADLV